MNESLNQLCKCVNWARAVTIKNHLTNHHPNCEHYDDSLIDVWKTTVDGVSCYVDNEQDAKDSAGDDGVIVKERMHREVFEHLDEFTGF